MWLWSFCAGADTETICANAFCGNDKQKKKRERERKNTDKEKERAWQIYGLLQQTIDLATLWFFLSSSSFASFPLCFHVFPAGGWTQFEALLKLLINLIEMVLDHKKKKIIWVRFSVRNQSLKNMSSWRIETSRFDKRAAQSASPRLVPWAKMATVKIRLRTLAHTSWRTTWLVKKKKRKRNAKPRRRRENFNTRKNA